MVIYFEKMMERLNLWRQGVIFGTIFEAISQPLTDEKWKSTMTKGGGNKKRFQYCIDQSRQEILYFRALLRQSGRNLIDLSLQDNRIDSNDFFEYTDHIGCAVNLHSVMRKSI